MLILLFDAFGGGDREGATWADEQAGGSQREEVRVPKKVQLFHPPVCAETDGSFEHQVGIFVPPQISRGWNLTWKDKHLAFFSESWERRTWLLRGS